MSTDTEKGVRGEIRPVDDVDSGETVNIHEDEVYSYEEQRKIIHRVDRRLLPACGLAFCVSLLDRTNVGLAAIAGMTQDLNLGVGNRLSIVLLIFFVAYIVFQPVTSASIRWIGPRNFMTAVVVSWAVLSVGAGFTTKWEQLAIIRVLLGITEAVCFPGSVYLLQTWYTRYEVQKRYAGFFMIAVITTSFNGILSFGFSQMDGMGGLAGWRWIFIMEGILTGVVAVIVYFLLVDFPEQAHKSWRFLNQQECAFMIRRIERDRADTALESFTLAKFLRPALDLKIWGFGMMAFCLGSVGYSFAYFAPVILKGMGFSTAAALCLTTPPFAFVAVTAWISAWYGDKYQRRLPVLLFNSIIGLIGVCLMGFAKGTAARYTGIFLGIGGLNANLPANMAYQANNIRGQWKRALSSGVFVLMGGIGGIAATLFFRQQDAPKYLPALYAIVACQLLFIVIILMLSAYFYRCNRKADRGEMVIEGLPKFRYTI